MYVIKKSVLLSPILYRFLIELYHNFECLNEFFLYFSILKSALTPTSNNNDNNDCFTDNDNTTMSNNGPVAEMLHQLDPSSIANEHHSHCNITENRASTPEESSTENSILNIGYESTFLLTYFILA